MLHARLNTPARIRGWKFSLSSSPRVAGGRKNGSERAAAPGESPSHTSDYAGETSPAPRPSQTGENQTLTEGKPSGIWCRWLVCTPTARPSPLGLNPTQGVAMKRSKIPPRAAGLWLQYPTAPGPSDPWGLPWPSSILHNPTGPPGGRIGVFKAGGASGIRIASSKERRSSDGEIQVHRSIRQTLLSKISPESVDECWTLTLTRPYRAGNPTGALRAKVWGELHEGEQLSSGCRQISRALPAAFLPLPFLLITWERG